MNIKEIIVCLSFGICISPAFSQVKNKEKDKEKDKEADRVKMEHAQIGIVNDNTTGYKQTTNPGAQWFANADFGMFIHWSIASVKEIDLSWPMMAGTQIGWGNPKKTSEEVKKIMDSGNYFSGQGCEKDDTCITPAEYWALAKDFNPKNYNPEKWIKAAKEAGMTYVVLTARHHDGFAMWPSKYGDFNTKNYMGGKDLVKDFVAACRKYGLKVGLYYSGPDWKENGEYQNFMYRTVASNYPDANVPVLDENFKPRTKQKTDAEKQEHYNHMANYIKGQVTELLTNYGKIDMIWFDGGPDIPKGNKAWNDCITMDQIHKLQPGIVVSPRFFGYGDYKTFEGDKALSNKKQDGWAELCTTITESGWGYTKRPMKSTGHVLNYLVKCRVSNVNMLLNFGPKKEGDFSEAMYNSLDEIADWMKINGKSIDGAVALDSNENASVPATANKNHRYLFLLAPKKGESVIDEKVVFTSNGKIKTVSLLGSKEKLKFTVENGKLMVAVPSSMRTVLPNVIDVELK